MKRDSFIFYASDYQSIKDMTDAQLGTFFRAICEFALYGSTKMEDKELKFAFNLLTDKIKRDQAKYDEVSKKRSEAGKKAWKKQMQANGGDSVSVSDNVCDNESEIIEIKKIFLFDKRVLPVKNEFDRFWNHYLKNNWLDGNGTPITDKIACARNWSVPKAKITLLEYQVSAWREIYDQLAQESDSYLLVTDLLKVEVDGVTLKISCTSAMRDFLEKHIDNVKDIVSSVFRCEKILYIVNNLKY